MSAHVTTMPTFLAKYLPMSNVTDAVTGFMAGSHVSWHVATLIPNNIHDSSYFICILMHTISFLPHSYTKLHHYGAIFCQALLFFLYTQKNQLTCWQNLGWFPAEMSFGRLRQHCFAECQANIFNNLLTWRLVSVWHVIEGVLATWHTAYISN